MIYDLAEEKILKTAKTRTINHELKKSISNGLEYFSVDLLKKIMLQLKVR